MRPRVCWQIVSHKTHHSKETKRNKRRWAALWHNTTVRRSSEETGLISGAWICWSPLRLTWSCVFCLPHSPQGESTCSKSPMLILMPHMVSSNKSKLYLHRGFNGWTQASVCGTAIVSSENSPKRRGDEKGGVYCWTWKCRQMRKNWEQNTSTQSNRKSLVSSNADDDRALQKKQNNLYLFSFSSTCSVSRETEGKIIGEPKKAQMGHFQQKTAFPSTDLSLHPAGNPGSTSQSTHATDGCCCRLMLPGGQQKCWLWRLSAMFTGVGAPAAGWLPALPWWESRGNFILFFSKSLAQVGTPLLLSPCQRQ